MLWQASAVGWSCNPGWRWRHWARLDDEGEPVRDIFQKGRGMRSRGRSVCKSVELSVIHVGGYCHSHQRRRGASGIAPFFIQSQCCILVHRCFEPTDLDIANTRFGDTTRILIGRNCTLYLRMQEKLINNGGGVRIWFGYTVVIWRMIEST